MRIRIVFAVVGLPLFHELSGPWLIRRFTFGRAAADVTENVSGEWIPSSSSAALSVPALTIAAALTRGRWSRSCGGRCGATRCGLSGPWSRTEAVNHRRRTIRTGSGFPHAGEIRLAVGRSRSRRLQIYFAVGGLWDIRRRKGRPLCVQRQCRGCRRGKSESENSAFHCVNSYCTRASMSKHYCWTSSATAKTSSVG